MTMKKKLLVAFISLCLAGTTYAGSCGGSDSCGDKSDSDSQSESGS